MKFAWFFLAEYINMFNVSAVCTTLFLGGWSAGPLTMIWEGADSGWWPVLWFVTKVWACMFFMIWTRGTLVRFRYDQFMRFGWKFLIPVALAWFVLVAIVQGLRAFTDMDAQQLLLGLSVICVVTMVVLFFWPESKSDKEEPESDKFDAFAGGYPVPPLPGQELPVSTRHAVAAKSAKEVEK